MPIRIESTNVVGHTEQQEAALVYVDDALAAILTRLTDDERDGTCPPNTWFLEFGFGRYAPHPMAQMFEDLDQIRAWAEVLHASSKLLLS